MIVEKNLAQDCALRLHQGTNFADSAAVVLSQSDVPKYSYNAGEKSNKLDII